MANTDNLEKVQDIQSEIQELMSETGKDEKHVQEDLNTLEQKIEYLEDNVMDARQLEELENMTKLFVETCHHLVKDVRIEKEINKELNELEQDEKSYIQFMNRLQKGDIPDERQERLKKAIGKIPKEKVESALEEDRKFRKREVREIEDQIDRLSQIEKDISFKLKGEHRKSLRSDARGAWVRLTNVEANLR